MQEVGVASIPEEGVSYILDTCIRCVALARIVHGDDHWILAKMHIQLAHCYLHIRRMFFSTTMSKLVTLGCNHKIQKKSSSHGQN